MAGQAQPGVRIGEQHHADREGQHGQFGLPPAARHRHRALMGAGQGGVHLPGPGWLTRGRHGAHGAVPVPGVGQSLGTVGWVPAGRRGGVWMTLPFSRTGPVVPYRFLYVASAAL